MSSNRPAEPSAERSAGGSRTRFWSPRTWSLRVRLLVTQVVLLATVCAGMGVATEFALQRVLLYQLDNQLLEAGRRSTAIFDMPPPMMILRSQPPGSPPQHVPGPGEPPGPQGEPPGAPQYLPGPPGEFPPPPGALPGPAPGFPEFPPHFPFRNRLDPEAGPGPGFLNAPGQAARTVGAVVGQD